MNPIKTILTSLKKRKKKNVLVFSTPGEASYLSKILMSEHNFFIWTAGLPPLGIEFNEFTTNITVMPQIPHIPLHIKIDLAICTNSMAYPNVKNIPTGLNMNSILLRYDYPPEGFIVSNQDSWKQVVSQRASLHVFSNKENKEKWKEEGEIIEFDDDNFIEKWEEIITKKSESIFVRI